jgi:hypothetical protein
MELGTAIAAREHLAMQHPFRHYRGSDGVRLGSIKPPGQIIGLITT